jgi:hypothetical protein
LARFKNYECEFQKEKKKAEHEEHDACHLVKESSQVGLVRVEKFRGFRSIGVIYDCRFWFAGAFSYPFLR